jgi:cytochrome bd ubiquinol oxidase subunit II
MNATAHTTLIHVWFCLIGLMLVLYVVTDGFDLGIGILSLVTRKEADRSLMMQTIGHVWDANETWLVVLGGALFGAFPSAYAMLLSQLYVPVMTMIGGFILRGAALEFRHPARRKRYWDLAFGVGSVIAALSQGVILGRVITGLEPGAVSTGFTVLTALGVASGYALLGATYLIQKVSGPLEHVARKYAVASVLTTVAAAILVSAGTMVLSPVAHSSWTDPRVFHILIVLGVVSAFAFVGVLYTARTGWVQAPFRASVLLFIASFGGLALSLFPDVIPGKLSLAQAAASQPTLVFMLVGIGVMIPVMLGYNFYQYFVFRGKMEPLAH